jgi:riboflavin biosynthesis pyrimidine reductase
VRRIHPGPPAEITDDELRAAYAYPATLPWVRANMVSTLDGAIRGPDGRSKSISSAADQKAFNAARAACDVVLVGAGTVRAEDYAPSSRTVAIVTARLDLPLTLRMFAERTEANPRAIAFTTSAAAAAAPATLLAAVDVVACGDDAVDLHRVVAVLVDRGLTRILCEGGPSLLSDLVAQGLLDELLLTLSPLLVGAPSEEHIVHAQGGFEGPRRFTTEQILVQDGTVLMRLLADRMP